MSDTEILSQVLNLGDEWYVKSVEVDQPSNRLDITIGYGRPAKKKSLFGRNNSADDAQNITLRHLLGFGVHTFLPVAGTVETIKYGIQPVQNSPIKCKEFLIEILNNSKSNQATSYQCLSVIMSRRSNQLYLLWIIMSHSRVTVF